MVQIIIDRATHRLEIAFTDGYSQDTLADFDTQLRMAAQTAKGTGNWFDILADFSHFGVMPQDATTAGTDRMEWCVANGLRRSANITSSTLMKLQIQRLSTNPRFQFFSSRELAIAWLEEEYSTA